MSRDDRARGGTQITPIWTPQPPDCPSAARTPIGGSARALAPRPHDALWSGPRPAARRPFLRPSRSATSRN